MNHAYHKPNPLLTDCVRTVLIIDGGGDAGENAQPIFTNGMPTLLCRTGSGHEHISNVSVFTNAIADDCWTASKSETIIAYFFKPFVLPCLFRLAAKTLARFPVDLSSWNAHKYNALKTQLVYADTIARKIEVLDNLIIQQQLENRDTFKIIQYATDVFMQNATNEVLPEILTTLNLNERTFQRIFKNYVGITPTQFRRISQFQLSFEQLRTKQFDKVSDVAFDNGFADQSHFIRSFREFTDTTPNDYLQNGLGTKK